jgi:hypothetical protein
VSSLFNLRARLAKLEAARPSPTRRFIVVVGEPDQGDRALLAALPGEVMLVSSGVCRDPLDEGPRRPVVFEQVADGRWLAADPQALAA